MNAVIYARYSSDSQREESIEGQLRECREYAERNNMTIVGTYIDRALSAKTADRPEFQHMIKDSAKELFEIVLVWKLDRFSRDRYDSAHYKHILKKNGVKVISAKEHISEGPEGIILEAMLEGYAEFYSAELSEKIHRGQKENALKGKNNGGGVPLGYLLDKKAQKLVIDPTTAPLVVEVFEKYADGKSVRSIVEDFNARGLKTKRGQPFNINSFSSLLKNRKYIGEYRYQDVVIEGGVPAIVPEDLFNRVQERMEKNRHAPAMAKAKEDYLLTTKLFCGKCERMMVGESGKSHTGAMHYYYKCSGAKRLKDCDKKAVRKDWIERVVVHLTMQRVMDEEKINRLIDAILVMQEQEDTTTPALRSQLAETESSIGNILKAIEQGIFTPSTKQRLDELEARKEEILVNIQTAELQKPKLTREQMTAWFEQFRHGDPANRDFQKRLIDTFVNAVYVFDDKLVLTYNYQHGTQTISLDEIASALGSDFDGATPPSSRTKKDIYAKNPEVSTTSGFFCAQFLKSEKKISKRVLAKSVDLYLYPRHFEPLFREFFGKAARFCSRQSVEFWMAFLLVLLDRHSKCMCHCVDTGKAQNTLGGFKMTMHPQAAWEQTDKAEKLRMACAELEDECT